jgi:hypothetical protein
MTERFTTSDLEEMRRAAIDYYEQRSHEFAHAFVPELRRGEIWLGDGGPRIGLWNVEPRGEGVALVRQPPFSPLMFHYGLVLVKREQGWVGESELRRIERVRNDDTLDR